MLNSNEAVVSPQLGTTTAARGLLRCAFQRTEESRKHVAPVVQDVSNREEAIRHASKKEIRGRDLVVSAVRLFLPHNPQNGGYGIIRLQRRLVVVEIETREVCEQEDQVE